jgi:uncharacterized iron-regulated protein
MFFHGKDHRIALDDFVFGSDTVSDLARRTEWDQNWGWPIRQYAKLLNYAKSNGIRIFGLNAPSRVTTFVEKNGIKGLLGRPGFPEVDLSDSEHRARFTSRRLSAAAVMASSNRQMKHAYEAQTMREEWMAGAVASQAKEMGGRGRVLAITGRNHVAGRRGVPERIDRRLDGWQSPLTVVMEDAQWDRQNRNSRPLVKHLPGPEEADWIWYMEQKKGCPLPI